MPQPEIFINVPLKEKDLKSEIDSLIPYVASLSERIQVLEKKLDEIYIYKDILEEIRKEKEIERKEKELIKKYGEIVKSQILIRNEMELFLSWLENKPKKIKFFSSSAKPLFKFFQGIEEYPPNLCPFVVLTKTTVGYFPEHLL